MKSRRNTRGMVVCTHVQYGSMENFTAHQKTPRIKKVYTLIPLSFFFVVLLVLFLMLKIKTPV